MANTGHGGMRIAYTADKGSANGKQHLSKFTSSQDHTHSFALYQTFALYQSRPKLCSKPVRTTDINAISRSFVDNPQLRKSSCAAIRPSESYKGCIMPVVVVESPAKAKTINKYLGSDYTVLASYGHVRDLPAKNGSVDTDNDFEMIWDIGADSRKHVKAIADALKTDDVLILATDPDREGEAISWHLQEALTKRRAIKKSTAVSRVVFNAITKTAVTEAMKNPRQVDMPLVDAYLARRALDYLVGFNLSPVLWRKLPGARSAGRVQSVCLRLIVEREDEIEAFNPQEYWTVKAMLETPRGQQFEARLTQLSGKKLDKFDLGDRLSAEMAVQAVSSRDLKIASVEAKPGTRNPSAPFMTSTMQQEASRKFGMGARQTMNAAQRLYEAGLITYMRTDGIDMAPEAITEARDAIKARYGDKYVPASPRVYKNKAKNAQEAHECIRPTELNKGPKDAALSDSDQAKLYDLIWKRTIASQMEAARLERTTVDITSQDQEVVLRATGQVVAFDGFMAVYTEGKDDAEGEEDSARLPQKLRLVAMRLSWACSTTPTHRRATPRRLWSNVWKSSASGVHRPMRLF
jgi:DNA topoisomerase-1